MVLFPRSTDVAPFDLIPTLPRCCSGCCCCYTFLITIAGCVTTTFDVDVVVTRWAFVAPRSLITIYVDCSPVTGWDGYVTLVVVTWLDLRCVIAIAGIGCSPRCITAFPVTDALQFYPVDYVSVTGALPTATHITPRW